MAALSLKRIWNPIFISNVVTPVLPTINSGELLLLKEVSVANFNALAAQLLRVYLVPTGEVLGNQHLKIPERSVPASQTDLCPELRGLVLRPGDQLYFLGNNADQMTCEGSGIIQS